AGIVAAVGTRVQREVQQIRARGGDVVFVRFPCSGPVYAGENRGFPRSLAWEPFLAQTHTIGVHFEDHRQLQGYSLPEWSHMAAGDRGRFTRALARIVVTRSPLRTAPRPIFCHLTLRKFRLTVSSHLR